MSVLPWHLLPDNSRTDDDGRLSIAGCDLIDLAAEYGTPLFVYDEDHVRARCREAVAAFPDGVAYATKAFLCTAMARLAYEEGMNLDVATGGELHVAMAAGVPAERLIFHGNNKSVRELHAAVTAGVGTIVIDSLSEIDRLVSVLDSEDATTRVMVRVNPGIEAHTHDFLLTGATDSKFGLSLVGDVAALAVARIRANPRMDLIGVHAHVGSQVFDVGSFAKAVEVLGGFVEEIDVGSLSLGGGLGVPYVEGESAPSITDWGEAIRSALDGAGLTTKVHAEPGRSIVARSAVTLYTAGTIKDIPGVRTYVSVDGGMSDNPRPVLYGSGYEVFLVRSTTADRDRPIRLVGKHCESGDVIVWDGRVPSHLELGDILATPVTGAYGHTMGSNYNMVLRPPVVFVSDGDARLVVRRETYDDLLARDLG
ncbi:MAG TPA: diaminopimelate decarboxylase [Acidimicrobiia bacterium]|nr:diaminopimelate decarboxylase [Acidimicrobiia bacterium]